MSETALPALENTDLTASSVPAATAVTPGAGDTPQDRPTEQTAASPDSSISASEQAPFQLTELESFKNLAAEWKLVPEQVEKLQTLSNDIAQRTVQCAQENKRAQTVAWAQQTRALYGAGLEREIGFALRAADTFGGPELRQLLEETGLGNHPVVIRTLSGIGRTISEDASTGGIPSAPQDKTFAEALYGKRN